MSTPKKKSRQRLRVILMILGPALVIGGGIYYWYTSGRYVSTDNAYVKSDNVMVSPEVSGRVVAVNVTDNDQVDAGTVLFQIDPQPYQLALQRAQAKVNDTRNQIESERAAYREAQARLQAAEADVAYLKRETGRKADLVKKDVVSTARFDELSHELAKAQAQRAATHQDIERLRASLGGQPDLPVEQQPAYVAAKAAFDQAQLDLDHTQIKAPSPGIVTHVDLQAGEMVNAGQPVFGLVVSDKRWVEANLKETDLTWVKPGQAATISVDAYPGREWKAHVESISPATGQVFSVLPAQNATGNWVKVVQRVPVRLAVDPESGAPPLRAGMSAEIEIDTGAHHSLGPIRNATATDRPADQH